jgi:hypothetical protein
MQGMAMLHVWKTVRLPADLPPALALIVWSATSFAQKARELVGARHAVSISSERLGKKHELSSPGLEAIQIAMPPAAAAKSLCL